MVTVRAIYENGKIRLLEDIELEEGQELQVKIISSPENIVRRVPDLHPGAFVFGDDFDEPLPDSFWLGEDE